jgi:uncharacterized membrane protein YfcA
MKKLYLYFLGLITGIINGLFGSGGGMVVVPLLEKAELEPHKAHATSIAIILPLSIISAFFYLKSGSFELLSALKFIPGGIAGALLGCLFLRKVPTKLLKKIFGILIIIAGVRMLLR